MTSAPASTPRESWPQTWKQAWEGFWFTPADPRPLAVVRIVVGLAAFAYVASFSSDLVRWFGPHGLLPPETSAAVTGDAPSFRFSVFRLANSPTQLWTIHGISLGVAAALTLGLVSRAAAAATLIAVLSYVHRSFVVGGLIEPVLAMFLLYLCVAPCGAYLSLDRLLRMPTLLRGSDQPCVAATISLRLMQVHLAALYAVMGVTKLYGNAWWDGEAVWLLLAQTHSRPLDLTFLRDYPLVLAGWTHLIAYTHLAFAPLVWNRLTRPIVLILAALTWLSLIPVMGQTLFCLFMAGAGMIYVPALLAPMAGRR